MPLSSQDTPRIWTVGQVLGWTRDRFAARGIPSPRLDAELLLAHALGWPRVMLYMRFEQPLSAQELARYRELVRRRMAGEPVAYLTGEREFWSLPLRVSPAVLVPRPETETLVEVALRLLDRRPLTGQGELTVHYDDPTESTPGTAKARSGNVPAPAVEGPPPRIADIGTGSGAVALALKKERPHARVLAVEQSEEALQVARDNATRLGLEVQLLSGDLLAPLALEGPFDLIVSNPPYIPTGDLPHLPPEVRAEPRAAIDGGADGLVIIRRLVRDAWQYLAPGGALALEVGDGQAGTVAELLRDRGYLEVTITDDLSRSPRVVSGRRPAFTWPLGSQPPLPGPGCGGGRTQSKGRSRPASR
ncbi:MAG: HemK/PrmC family methyltransferase [Myxococcales bacterium]|nr:HemK/PrmC family methyltransferase [Myxococcales bacterium]